MFPKEEVSSKIGLNESFVGIAWLLGPMMYLYISSNKY